jgi:hypothetical protein
MRSLSSSVDLRIGLLSRIRGYFVVCHAHVGPRRVRGAELNETPPANDKRPRRRGLVKGAARRSRPRKSWLDMRGQCPQLRSKSRVAEKWVFQGPGRLHTRHQVRAPTSDLPSRAHEFATPLATALLATLPASFVLVGQADRKLDEVSSPDQPRQPFRLRWPVSPPPSHCPSPRPGLSN